MSINQEPGRPAGKFSRRAGERPRLAILISHPIQHFCPMYRCLAADGRVELLVIFAEKGAEPQFDVDFGLVTRWQDNLVEGVPHVVIKAPAPERSAAVLSQLATFDPHVLYLHGYNLPYLRESMKWAGGNSVPILMSTDSELRFPRPLHKRIAKRFLLPWIFRKVALFLTVGDANEDYFAHYGVSRHKFLRTPFSIDSEDYDRALAHRAELREGLRAQLGVPQQNVVLLNVAKLTPIKSQDYLIRAFLQAVSATGIPATLLIAGDGPERPRLEQLAAASNGSVRLLGFVSVNDLPAYYLASDLYVHPSSFDPHPLAVSEAIYCSLPLVASDRIGSSGPTDDLQDGKNGWIFPFGDDAALTALLTRLLPDSALRAQAGAMSAQLGPMHAAPYVAGRFIEGTFKVLGQTAAGAAA